MGCFDDISLIAKKPSAWPVQSAIAFPEFKDFRPMPEENEDPYHFNKAASFQNSLSELMKFRSNSQDEIANPTAQNWKTNSDVGDFYHLPEYDLPEYSTAIYSQSEAEQSILEDNESLSQAAATFSGTKNYNGITVTSENVASAATLARESLARVKQSLEEVQTDGFKENTKKADVHNLASSAYWMLDLGEEGRAGLLNFSQGKLTDIIDALSEKDDESSAELGQDLEALCSEVLSMFDDEELAAIFEEYKQKEMDRFLGKVCVKKQGMSSWNMKKRDYQQEKDMVELEKRNLKKLQAKQTARRKQEMAKIKQKAMQRRKEK